MNAFQHDSEIAFVGSWGQAKQKTDGWFKISKGRRSIVRSKIVTKPTWLIRTSILSTDYIHHQLPFTKHFQSIRNPSSRPYTLTCQSVRLCRPKTTRKTKFKNKTEQGHFQNPQCTKCGFKSQLFSTLKTLTHSMPVVFRPFFILSCELKTKIKSERRTWHRTKLKLWAQDCDLNYA